jgi:cytochrome c oxidase cbb3-type subunit III
MLGKLLRPSIWMLLACTGLLCGPLQSLAQQSGKAAGSNSTVAGKQVFVTTCAACHGLDGAGGEHGPDIAHRQEIQHLTDKALLQIVRNGVPGTAMPAFGSLGSAQIQAVVQYLRTLQGQTTAKLPGDPTRGQVLFFGRPGCSDCHMTNGKGGFMGPDLSSYANTLSVDDIRSAITDPNKNLDPRRRAVIVTTQDGQTLTGIARNEDNFSVQLQTTDGALHLLAKSELESIEYQSHSLMPGDYGSRLSRQELDDLVSYLISIARNKTEPESEQE